MKKGEKTRERMITATAELLQERGFFGTGLNDIVRRAKAPKGSLYFHFPGGKEELCAAAAQQAGQTWQQEILGVLAEAPDLATGIRAVCALLAERLETSSFGQGCPVATVALEAAASSETLQAVCADVYETWQREVEGYLTRAGVPPGRAPALATTTIAAVEGAMLLAKAYHSSEPLVRLSEQLTLIIDVIAESQA